MPKINQAALTACITHKVEIDVALERIRTASDDHFFASPDEVNWGHVSALADHAELFNRITDALYHEGERAR